jgi:hypothetical protein
MSNEKKQTSIDFFAQHSREAFRNFEQGTISMMAFKNIALQVEIVATAMHKEEIKNAYNTGSSHEFENIYHFENICHGEPGSNSVKYYNETFKQ